jgi:SWI/SNF-related matrix-associated actin-dependent regulator of chromatin subfamily A-like protein 1
LLGQQGAGKSSFRQLAAQGKLAQFKEWLREWRETGEKLVVFGWHTDILKELRKEFGGGLIIGEIGQDERQKAIDDFQKGNDQFIFLGLLAGGVGITLTAGANMVIYELPWRPGDLDQAEGRTHRFTQQRACTCYYHLATDTIDDWLFEIINKKRALADAALDGVLPEDEESVADELLTRLQDKYIAESPQGKNVFRLAAVGGVQ